MVVGTFPNVSDTKQIRASVLAAATALDKKSEKSDDAFISLLWNFQKLGCVSGR